MKRTFQTLFLKPMLLLLIFVLIVYLPKSISAPPEGVERQHISSIGIDIAPEGIELSVLTHVSSQSDKYKKTYIVTSTTAESIPFALFRISSITGRKSALTHTTTIVVSQEIAQKGLHNYLDYFYRNDNVANDTFVVCTTGKAKDLLNFEKDRINSAGYGLEEVLIYNAENTYFADSNLESFYKGYFSPTKTSMLAVAELEPNPDGEQTIQSGSGSSGQQSGGSNSGQTSSASQTGPQRIKSLGKLALFKEGKLVDTLDTDLIFGLNVVTNNTHNIYFTIENFTDDVFQNALIEFNIITNQLDYQASFEGNHPVLTINSLVSLNLESVISEYAYKEYYMVNINPLSARLKNAVSQKIRLKFGQLLKNIIQNKTDIFGVYTILHNQLGNKFLDWYKTLDNPEDFLGQVEYRMTTNPILTS